SDAARARQGCRSLDRRHHLSAKRGFAALPLQFSRRESAPVRRHCAVIRRGAAKRARKERRRGTLAAALDARAKHPEAPALGEETADQRSAGTVSSARVTTAERAEQDRSLQRVDSVRPQRLGGKRARMEAWSNPSAHCRSAVTYSGRH